MSAPDPLWDVVGIGANSVDYVNVLPGYPQPFGSFAKMRIAQQRVFCGGQMATAMSTCARLGLRAKYIGATGTDENGRIIRQELARRNVDLTDLIIRDAPNQFAVILVDETSGDRIVLWDRDERLCLRERDIPIDAIAAARVVHVDDVDEGAALVAARVAQQAGTPVTTDLDRLTDRTEELVASVSHPIFAEHVPAHLTGKADPEQALRKLRTRHSGLLCITLGDRGVMALDGDRLYHVPAFQVHALDTTGAGDVFRGAFLYGLVQGFATEELLRFANAAAAVSCTRLGALNGVPALDEVRELVAAGQVRG
jgi:sugar/nucleoside kinase (ribokinase family)